MSVIAARVTDLQILIAADSILTKNDLKQSGFKKLIKTNNIVIGGCGCAAELCLMFEFVEQHSPKNSNMSSIIEFLKEFSDYKETVTGNKDLECEYILVVDSKLFVIDGFFVQHVKDYAAIGAGEAYALAALHLGYNPSEAVKCACDLCCETSEPIYTVSVNTFA